jgi:hypothetical protein
MSVWPSPTSTTYLYGIVLNLLRGMQQDFRALSVWICFLRRVHFLPSTSSITHLYGILLNLLWGLQQDLGAACDDLWQIGSWVVRLHICVQDIGICIYMCVQDSRRGMHVCVLSLRIGYCRARVGWLRQGTCRWAGTRHVHRVGQKYIYIYIIYIYIYSVHTVILAGIWIKYTACINGSGQPYTCRPADTGHV